MGHQRQGKRKFLHPHNLRVYKVKKKITSQQGLSTSTPYDSPQHSSCIFFQKKDNLQVPCHLPKFWDTKSKATAKVTVTSHQILDVTIKWAHVHRTHIFSSQLQTVSSALSPNRLSAALSASQQRCNKYIFYQNVLGFLYNLRAIPLSYCVVAQLSIKLLT